MFADMRGIVFAALSLFFISDVFAAPNLTAEINMDIRAATASKAKAEASESATRGGIIQVLSRYSDRAVVENLIMGADETVLQNLVASTRISNEKTSKTAYAAHFTVTLDRAAAMKWYGDNNVPNFLDATDGADDGAVTVHIELSNGVSDWVHLNQIMRESGESFGLSLKSIYRNNATASIRASKKRRFQSLCASSGWTVGARDGSLRIAR